MRILLDTHVFIWAVLDDARLTADSRALIHDADAVYVSAASIWEISIKSGLGKLDVSASTMKDAIELSGFIGLPITIEHAVQLAKIPLDTHHKDPFDRMLIAQSIAEPLILLTADSKLAAYGGLVRMV